MKPEEGKYAYRCRAPRCTSSWLAPDDAEPLVEKFRRTVSELSED
jgi:hypothetical protein